MDIKSEAIELAAASIILGFKEAAVEAAAKVFAMVVCKVNDIPLEKRPEIEKELKWLTEEKVKELSKEQQSIAKENQET